MIPGQCPTYRHSHIAVERTFYSLFNKSYSLSAFGKQALVEIWEKVLRLVIDCLGHESITHQTQIVNLVKKVRHNGCYIGSRGMGISESTTFYLPSPRVLSLQHLPHTTLSIVSFHLSSKNPGTIKYTILLPAIFETLPKFTYMWQAWVRSVAPCKGE